MHCRVSIDSEVSDEEGDTFFILLTERLGAQDVQVTIYWGFGPVHKLPADSEPAHNFGLFFGNETFKLMANIEIKKIKIIVALRLCSAIHNFSLWIFLAVYFPNKSNKNVSRSCKK